MKVSWCIGPFHQHLPLEIKAPAAMLSFCFFPLALPPVWVCVWCSLPPQALPMLFSQTDLLSGTSWKPQIPFSRSKHGEAGLACQKTELTNCWCAKISVDRPTWIPGHFPIQTECCFTDQKAKTIHSVCLYLHPGCSNTVRWTVMLLSNSRYVFC